MKLVTRIQLLKTIHTIKSHKENRLLRDLKYHLREIDTINETIELLNMQKEQHYIMADHLVCRLHDIGVINRTGDNS